MTQRLQFAQRMCEPIGQIMRELNPQPQVIAAASKVNDVAAKMLGRQLYVL